MWLTIRNSFCNIRYAVNCFWYHHFHYDQPKIYITVKNLKFSRKQAHLSNCILVDWNQFEMLMFLQFGRKLGLIIYLPKKNNICFLNKKIIHSILYENVGLERLLHILSYQALLIHSYGGRAFHLLKKLSEHTSMLPWFWLYKHVEIIDCLWIKNNLLIC